MNGSETATDSTFANCERGALLSPSDAARVLRIPGSAPGRRLCHELERRQTYVREPLWTRTAGGHRRVNIEQLRRLCPDLVAAAESKTAQQAATRAERQLVDAVQLQLADLFASVQVPMVDATGELRALVGDLRKLIEDLKATLHGAKR
jgi:hypothetical protein